MENTIESIGELFIVPTPIGNIEDITLRAISVLKSVDVVACEDKRETGKLLKLLDIKANKLISYHNFNERNSSLGIIQLIQNGNKVALVSDAGYPLVSDPGYNLIKQCKLNNIKITPLPGASAILPALVASGLNTDSFVFLGFPPQKKGRKTFIENAVNYDKTVIMYESPHKIIKLLQSLSEILEVDRKVSIAREISKMFEEYILDSPQNIIEYLEKNNKVKGEFVVLIERKQ